MVDSGYQIFLMDLWLLVKNVDWWFPGVISINIFNSYWWLHKVIMLDGVVIDGFPSQIINFY